MNPRSIDRLAAGLSIMLLAMLAGGSWYLARYGASLDITPAIDRTRHEPDAFVTGLRLTRIGEDGNPVYRLDANKGQHYPDDDSIGLFELEGHGLDPKRPPVIVRADRGVADSGVKLVTLTGNVVLDRPATPEAPAMRVTTGRAEILTAEEIVRTDDAVHVQQGNSYLNGVGMVLNNSRHTLDVLSKVRAEWFDADRGTRPGAAPARNPGTAGTPPAPADDGKIR